MSHFFGSLYPLWCLKAITNTSQVCQALPRLSQAPGSQRDSPFYAGESCTGCSSAQSLPRRTSADWHRPPWCQPPGPIRPLASPWRASPFRPAASSPSSWSPAQRHVRVRERQRKKIGQSCRVRRCVFLQSDTRWSVNEAPREQKKLRSAGRLPAIVRGNIHSAHDPRQLWKACLHTSILHCQSCQCHWKKSPWEPAHVNEKTGI